MQVALVVKNLPASAGDVRDVGLIPESGRWSGEGHGNTPVFLPGKSHGLRGAWWATSDTTSGLAHKHVRGFSATRWVSFPNPFVDQESTI